MVGLAIYLQYKVQQFFKTGISPHRLASAWCNSSYINQKLALLKLYANLWRWYLYQRGQLEFMPSFIFILFYFLHFFWVRTFSLNYVNGFIFDAIMYTSVTFSLA